ncbi:FIG01057804: hypothetical protein [hydrothermal vent metagenome]|uniref:DUF3570 domain-containing protein n=1 Tax=hydrothermal vent metagenome TaxID=652676 RepID=A0A3B0XZT8_9ZZZZ
MSKLAIKTTLSSACYCLLGSSVSAETKPWFIDLGAMNYIEQDRNTGIEFMVNGARELSGGDAISLQLDFDVITGATPNGATASDVPQTFTQSSGIGSYTVGANELPADGTHMDTRMAFSLGYTSALNENLNINYNSHLSMEFDYFSLGGGAEFSQDFYQHTSTLVGGFDFEYNRVHPVGGIPIEFAFMQPPGTLQPKGVGSVTRRQSGVHIGFNQILNKNSLMQFKYAWANATGYLTDPYKILSVIDNQNQARLGSTLGFVYEGRPDQREIQNVYFAYKVNLQGNVFDFSYRYYWDEWDINSNTFDFKYRYEFANRIYLQPHFRFYGQTAASFYQHSLKVSEGTPDYASADFRLAEFDAYTIGFRYGKTYAEGREHSIGLEYYTQRGESHPDSAVGLQKSQDLFPTLNTLIVTWNYAYFW